MTITNYNWYYMRYRRKEFVVPISGKDLCKLFEKAGYKIVPGGKGSHIKLKKKNCPTVIIPNHKELSTGLEHALMKLLKTQGRD